KKEESYIAVKLDGTEPEIIFMKGPDFTKQMGPYPLEYAEATFQRWSYSRVSNPPEIDPSNKTSLHDALAHISRQTDNSARHMP
ncbi:MAG: hypothetical protein GY868_13755, partial [Deltaproteobacteria bacterium]|nr:hypothetical protein [Deltaproteobacteria bacterium]